MHQPNLPTILDLIQPNPDTMKSKSLVIVTLMPLLPLRAAESDPAPNPKESYQKATELLASKDTPGKAQMAIAYLVSAATAGDAEAANRLGYSYETGQGVKADAVKARSWYEKAAEGGLAKAKYNLGLFLVLGKGGAAESERGFTMLEEAAREGIVPAQLGLGRIFYFGEYGQKQDYARAFPYFEQAAKAGNAEAQNFLGVMCRLGKGTKIDHKASAQWYLKAANQGLAKAQAAVADAYRMGSGIKRDKIEALKFYMLAAEQGEVTAKNPMDEWMPSLDPDTIAEATQRADDFKAQFKKQKEVPAQS